MSSDFWSRSRGPSEYTTSPLEKKQQFKIPEEGLEVAGRKNERTDYTYHTMASLGIVNISAGS